ncbi:MAG: alcohol dehydrogenase [Myxococcaceae bacterium]|nr:alcohol dehydrogenase [Myxococcaceae bacterium]
MRAVTYSSFGDPAVVLEVTDRPVPEPQPGQARVKMQRAAIHNHDLWTIRGSYGQRPPLPAIGGSEAAGIVDAVGDGVTNVRVGDRVAGFAAGAWCELFVTPAAGLLPLPDAITDDVGCQLVAMPLSAMALLDTYAVEAPDFIVQNAANGAVGKTLAMLAKARGTNVLHLVRSAEAVRELADQGIEGAISTAEPDWKKQAKAAVGGAKIRCAIDSIGGASSGDICSLLSSDGKLVAFGSMSGEPMHVDSGALIFKRITVEGFWLSKQNAVPPEKSKVMIGELVQLASKGVLDLPVAGVFPLERAAEAATASVRASRRGKVLLSP